MQLYIKKLNIGKCVPSHAEIFPVFGTQIALFALNESVLRHGAFYLLGLSDCPTVKLFEVILNKKAFNQIIWVLHIVLPC